jgi:hypothetical protein
MPTAEHDILHRLAEDLRTAAWLLPADDALRGHLEMLGALPSRMDAWEEVLRPWLHAVRGGALPSFDSPPRLAAAGAIALATARAARELHEEDPVGVTLRCMARWCARSAGAPTHS